MDSPKPGLQAALDQKRRPNLHSEHSTFHLSLARRLWRPKAHKQGVSIGSSKLYGFFHPSSVEKASTQLMGVVCSSASRKGFLQHFEGLRKWFGCCRF